MVSEETGIISVADRGKFMRNLNADDLRILLRAFLAIACGRNPMKWLFRRWQLKITRRGYGGCRCTSYR